MTMGDAHKLTLPRVRVLRDGHDPLELQVLNPDLLRWDVTRGKHRWPTMKEGPNLWLTFLSWSAAHRTGATGDTWEVFRDSCLEVSTIEDDDEDDDDDEEGVADPFPEDPAPDS
jgi:hypothetical protein